MMISEFIMHYLGISAPESPEPEVITPDAQDFSLVECTCGCRNFSASYNEPYLRIICQKCGRIVEILSRRPGHPAQDTQQEPQG